MKLYTVPSDLNHLRHRDPASVSAISLEIWRWSTTFFLHLPSQNPRWKSIFFLFNSLSVFYFLARLPLLSMYLLSFKEVYVYVQTLPFLSIYFTAVFSFLLSLSLSTHWHCKSAFGAGFFLCIYVCVVHCCCCFCFFSFRPMLSLTVRDISFELKFCEQTYKTNWMTCIYIHSRFCTWKPKAREN